VVRFALIQKTLSHHPTSIISQDCWWSTYSKDCIAPNIGTCPCGKLGPASRPNDLDGAVVFLASKSSLYVTGQTLPVDGGISTGATSLW
jgi:NAD(P)-dependent dehydrogenase (short-subunit alcohol dehydrogenase family)